MANATKKFRCPNWSHEETVVLADLKRDTFFQKKEGRLVWEQIAQRISSRFPNQKRSQDQCRRRWETLTKTYKHIEEYCAVTCQEHWELDEDELSSMKLDTAYGQDWYNIVKEVCSQRKRREKGECTDVRAVKRSKGSDTCSSPSSVLPEPMSGIDSLDVTPPTSICAPVITTIVNEHTSTPPSLEAEKLSAEEEIRRLHTISDIEKDALIFQLEQLRRHGLVAQQDQTHHWQVRHNSPAEVTAHVKEPLQDAVSDYGEVTVERSSKAAERDGIGCELMVTRSRSLSPEFFSEVQHSGAMNLAGFNDPFDYSTYFSTTLSFPTTESMGPHCTWINGIRFHYLRRRQGCSTSTYQGWTQKASTRGV